MPEPLSNSSAERLAQARARWDAHPLYRYFALTLDELDDGFARCSLHASATNRGGVHGSVHGGILAFIADVVGLAAVSTVLGPGERSAGTAELNISYLRPAMGAVAGQARILRKGRTLVVADVDLIDDDGNLLAKGRVAYALRRFSEQDASGGAPDAGGAG